MWRSSPVSEQPLNSIHHNGRSWISSPMIRVLERLRAIFSLMLSNLPQTTGRVDPITCDSSKRGANVVWVRKRSEFTCIQRALGSFIMNAPHPISGGDLKARQGPARHIAYFSLIYWTLISERANHQGFDNRPNLAEAIDYLSCPLETKRTTNLIGMDVFMITTPWQKLKYRSSKRAIKYTQLTSVFQDGVNNWVIFNMDIIWKIMIPIQLVIALKSRSFSRFNSS